jgi:hypothetical protein
MPPTPDLLLLGGRLWSAGPLPAGADSVAVVNGRIVEVGTRAAVRDLAGARTRSVDLRGRSLLPAFADAHVHPISAGLDHFRCDLSDVPVDAAAYRDAVARYAADHPGSGWIVGSGWVSSAFPGGMPDATALDADVPDRPVYLEAFDGHHAWLNSAALRAAGIGPGTPDPPLGRIVRDASARPTGTLQERAMDLVLRLLPEPAPPELEAALAWAQTELHRLGIAAWCDASVTADRLAAYLRADAAGRLTARVTASLLWDETDGLGQLERLEAWRASVPAAGRVRATTVKVFLDGVIEGRTAAMLDPYLDRDGRLGSDRGDARFEPASLTATVRRLVESGFDVHGHAIGDRAVRDALDAFESVRARSVADGRRHHLAHLQCVDPADVPRFAALGVTANIQPYWAQEDDAIRDLTRPIVGDERTDRMYAFRSLLDAGADLAMGSDWSVSTPDPLRLLHVAVHRTDPATPDAEPFVPSERLPLDAALRAATAGASRLLGLDPHGTLSPGAAADVVIIDRDIAVDEGWPLAEAQVETTLIDGRIVHGELPT